MRVFGELGSFFLRNSVACWALRALPLVTLVVGCLPIGSAGRNNNLPADEPVSDDYLLPFPPGVPRFCGQSNFGVAGLGSHATEYAIDFVMPDDSPVWAARGGIVVGVRDACPNVNCPFDPSACCGNYVRIQHADMTTASYVHLRQWGSCVVVGQRVERGDIIGRSGNTGYSVTSHLHIAVFAAPGEIGSGDFGPSTNNSMQFIFADVEENGVPRIGRWYFSSNQVGLDHCLP